MEKIDHKKIDKEVFGIISEDIKKHEFIWKEDLNKWILSEQARIEAAARGGYKLGQLVHLAREDMLMTLAPDDITGVPFTGSASRRDCDPGSIIAGLKLPFPLFAANMESVTDEKLAITTALMGGVGILHQFQTVKKQVKQIRAVKNTAVKKITIDSRTYEPAIDPKGRLLVAGASGLRNNYTERIEKMVKAEVDIIVLDVAHGDSVQMYKVIKEIREKFPDTILAAGNIITPKAAYMYSKLGVDIIKANVGPGFACTTRKVTGFGVPTISGLYDVVTVAKKFGVDVIADGGIYDSGTAVKYFATGVKGIIMGSMLGATNDSADFKKRYDPVKRKVKIWGSASSRAKEHQGRPRWDAAEGIVREVDCLGETDVYISTLITGIQSGLSYAGVSDDGRNNLARLARYSRWTLQTAAGSYEGKKRLNK